jgi:leucyl-tRNA synthetase
MSEQDIPAFRYSADFANRIEAKWQDYWEQNKTFYAPNPVGDLADPGHPRYNAAKKFVLDMFPYPSGAGLHVGHPLGYIGTDVFARYQRMAGFNVLHAMGYDAFGLPAEQYAVSTGTHPRTTTVANIARYRQQFRQLGMGHDPRRSVETIDPEYYRWTQWIFLQIYNSWYDPEVQKARPITELEAKLAHLPADERNRIVDESRLAYISEAPVNWCPGLGTVLANEEVTADGRSERGNFPVFKRNLRQWMMRITAYCDRLIDDLELLDWPEPIKLQQRNWIGRSTGAYIDFPADGEKIRVFTTRPDTVFGATYMVLAPEHELVDKLVPAIWPLETHEKWTGGHTTPEEAVAAYREFAAAKSDVERQADAKAKTGVFTGAFATNPLTNAPIPIFIADYVLAGYGTGAIMAVPGQDERDWEFAEVFELPIIRTVQPSEGFAGKAFTGEGPAINSVASAEGDRQGISLDGLGVVEAKAKIIAYLEDNGIGEGAITYRLRDWLFSRQRYWGEPFPIVYDTEGRAIALPEEMLPVELPEVKDFSPKTYQIDDAQSNPETPLSRATEWVEVELDLGDGPRQYKRETNVMPQWAGSCWYQLRYLDPHNSKEFVDPANEKYWVGPKAQDESGGVDLYVGGAEHAVLHLLYARFWHKVLFDLGHVSGPEPYHRLFNQGMIQAYAYTDERGAYVPAEEVTEEQPGIFVWNGQKVNREFGKIGKSLKNVVTPDEMCERYGADTFRVYEMSMGPLDVSRPWETRAVVGAQRFLQRVWRAIVDESTGSANVSEQPADKETSRVLHKTIHGVREDMAELRFNTAIAKLIELTNALTKLPATPREVAESLVIMVSPFAPHIAEELWEKLGHKETITYASFPVADESLLVESTVTYPVQVNGKVRARIEIAADAAEEAIKMAALAEVGITDPKKVIVIPGRLVSVVA